MSLVNVWQGIVDDVRTKIMEIEEIYIPDLAPAA